jgi:hypothetical protein
VNSPSIGRIVHYVSFGTPGGEYASECRAAVITAVHGTHGAVDLCVLNPTGMFFDLDVMLADLIEHTAMYPGGTWHWPERVDDRIDQVRAELARAEKEHAARAAQ